jgi:MFS transporter, DHA2 family, multidrug resistance protein
MAPNTTAVARAETPSTAPAKAGIVLTTLIVVAAVANLPLAMANVALPSIGAYFDASQTQLNVAPRSAKLVHERGSRFTLLLSFTSVLIAFVLMLLLWKEGIPYWKVAIGYIFLGISVGLGGTPSSNSLTASVPVTRVGMASGTADLQRDLGGALMQSIFGALLAMGFATAMGAAITASPEGATVTASVTSQLEMSYASAQTIAAQYPQYATQITAAAKTSFLAGDQYAYIAGIIAILLGAILIFLKYPKKDEEAQKLAAINAQDMAAMAAAADEAATAPAAANAAG